MRRNPQSTTRLFCGLLALFIGGLLHAAEPEHLQVSRDSAFIQRLLQGPITTNPQDTRIAALILFRTGNDKDAAALTQFEKRRLLARFLGEQFEFSGTVGQAIEAESAAEPLEKGVSRALASVTIEYASPDSIPPGTTAESELSGNDIQMPMAIRHSLQVPASTVGIQIENPDGGRSQPYYLFLTCKPVDAQVFAPGVSQPAVCAGRAERKGGDLAIKALLERQIPAPLPAYSFMTREADLYDNFLRVNDERGFAAASAAATRMLASARCEDLGNCEEVAKARTAARWQAARPGVLAALTIATFLLAAFAGIRTPARTSTGWFVNSLSILVIAASILAIVIMFDATAPDLGLEGFVHFAVLFYGLVPHLVAVGVIAASLSGGRATRLRMFAVTLGLLTPLVVWLSILAFAW